MLPYDSRFGGLDRMTGAEFEAALADLFEGLGHSVHRNGGYDDKGVDLIVDLAGVSTAIQAKRWAPSRRTGLHPRLVRGEDEVRLRARHRGHHEFLYPSGNRSRG
jgi:hypothetical protein